MRPLNHLAFRLRLGRCLFPAGQLLFVLPFRFPCVKVLNLAIQVLDRWFQLGKGLLGLGAHPGLDRRAAPRGIDQPDRHVELLVQLTAEEVACGREVAHGLRAAKSPVASAIVLRLRGRLAIDGEQADFRVVGRGNLGILVGHTTYAHRHVRLARAEPHLADQYVGKLDQVGLALHLQLQRSAGLERIELERPFSGTVRGYRLGLIAQGDRHLFGRVGPTPNRNWHFALQHHVVAEHARQLHVSRGDRDQTTNREDRTPGPQDDLPAHRSGSL